MKELIIKIVKNLTPPILIKIIKRFFLDNKTQKNEILIPIVKQEIKQLYHCYSQYYEDLLIDSLLSKKQKGFYVDVGANDPNLLSNTARFYRNGWHGINIEPNKMLYEKFLKYRPKDINLNFGVDSEEETKTFYLMSADTLSSFNKDYSLKLGKLNDAKFISEAEVKVLPLSVIFERYLPKKTSIDFISIDVEGLDFEVLKSNDWKKYRSKLLIVEIMENGREIIEYLNNQNYILFFQNGTNGIFIDSTKKF